MFLIVLHHRRILSVPQRQRTETVNCVDRDAMLMHLRVHGGLNIFKSRRRSLKVLLYLFHYVFNYLSLVKSLLLRNAAMIAISNHLIP